MFLVQKTIFFSTCLKEKGPYVLRLGQEYSLYTLNQAGGWVPVRRIDCVTFVNSMKIKFILFCNDLQLRLFKKVHVKKVNYIHYTDMLAWLFTYRTFVIADFIEKACARRNLYLACLSGAGWIVLYCIVHCDSVCTTLFV